MEDDEWFFNSFERYNELQMFDFPNTVYQMDLTSTNNLCVALDGEGKNRNEVLIFFLPSSLRTSKSIQGVKLDRHLSFDHGYFTSSRLLQIKCVPNDEKLFISERNGVALYDINCSDSDIIKKLTDLSCGIPDVHLAVSGVNHYVACSSTSSNLKTIVNFESMNTVLSIDDKRTVDSGTESLALPMFSSPEVISFGDTVTGQITSYDVRDGKHVNTIAASGVSAHWRFNTTFDIKRQTVDESSEIFLFSTNGDFLVYDVRKPSYPTVQAKHNLPCKDSNASGNVQMNVCPTNTEHFFVCGFDENLYVCDMNENTIKVLFTHDGHSHNADDFEPDVQTTCALWLPFISTNTLVSCGSNSSVQCWQFKVS